MNDDERKQVLKHLCAEQKPMTAVDDIRIGKRKPKPGQYPPCFKMLRALYPSKFDFVARLKQIYRVIINFMNEPDWM